MKKKTNTNNSINIFLFSLFFSLLFHSSASSILEKCFKKSNVRSCCTDNLKLQIQQRILWLIQSNSIKLQLREQRYYVTYRSKCLQWCIKEWYIYTRLTLWTCNYHKNSTTTPWITLVPMYIVSSKGYFGTWIHKNCATKWINKYLCCWCNDIIKENQLFSSFCK